jgi:hypothetical protein
MRQKIRLQKVTNLNRICIGGLWLGLVALARSPVSRTVPAVALICEG